jgi:hypothetical protein
VSPEVTTVPYRLSFAGPGRYKPGRGEAGWTIAAFETSEQAAAFVAAHPEAEMPCWRRWEAQGGKLVQVR